MDNTDALLRVEGIRKFFPVYSGFFNKVSGHLHAVDDVSFRIQRGETLGLVGESGCGKTTLGKMLVRAYPATGGKVFFKDESGVETEILSMKEGRFRPMRKNFQMIFQDPQSSLDPRMTVYDIISEPILAGKLLKQGPELEERVRELAQHVGLRVEHLRRYPHAFSGGQRQRIGIARALSTMPKLIVADEAVSSLDVSVQAQVLNLLKELQQEFNLTYLFVAHSLSVIKHLCNRVAVMYLGKIVEMSDTLGVYDTPAHPYTEALLSAAPVPEPGGKRERIILYGDPPTPLNPPPGCRFQSRCRYAKDVCSKTEPLLVPVSPSHMVACHRLGELTLRGV